jgi:hypothetical protein
LTDTLAPLQQVHMVGKRPRAPSKSGAFYWESIRRKPQRHGYDSLSEANFLNEFLMKSSGLLMTFTPIFSEAAPKECTRHDYRAAHLIRLWRKQQ